MDSLSFHIFKMCAMDSFSNYGFFSGSDGRASFIFGVIYIYIVYILAEHGSVAAEHGSVAAEHGSVAAEPGSGAGLLVYFTNYWHHNQIKTCACSVPTFLPSETCRARTA